MPHCAGLGCYREAYQIPAGKNYEACRSVHAEQNALQMARAVIWGDTVPFQTPEDLYEGHLREMDAVWGGTER